MSSPLIENDQQSNTASCENLKLAFNTLIQENADEIFSPSVYDNSSFPYFMLEPGQIAIKKDSILFRLKKDIDYERFLEKGRRFKLKLLAKGEKSTSQDEFIDSLSLDQAYYLANRTPYFLYKFSIEEETIVGKRLLLSIQNEGDSCVVENIIELACCNGSTWADVGLKQIIAYPSLDILPQTYHYAGFTGVLDIQFDNNSPAIRDAQYMLERVQNQIDRFKGLDYKIEEVNISGYASIKGDAQLNKNLSTNRAKTLYEGLIKRNPDVNIQYAGLGEDWRLTKKLFKDLDHQDESLTQILDSSMSNDEKEAALYNLNLAEDIWESIFSSTRHTVALLKFSYQGKGASLTSYPDSLPLESEALNEAALWQVDLRPYSEEVNIERQLDAISNLINEKPTSELYALRANYLTVQGNYGDALTAIQKAEAIDEKKWQTYKWAIQLNGFENFSNTEKQNLSKELEPDSSLDSSENLKMGYTAILQEKFGDLNGAYKTWQQLSEIRSLTPSELNNLAVNCIKTQQHYLAEDYLSAALIKNNNLAEAHYNQAVLYAYRGLTKKSASHIRQVISLKPEWKEDILSNPAFRYVKLDARFEAALEGHER